MTGWMVLWLSAAHAAPGDPTHTVGLRYRRAVIPDGILDLFFFDQTDAGAHPYERPKVKANVVGLEYTLSLRPDGGTSFVFWGERMSFPFEAGYWDDAESPADHDDGDWLAPQKGLGLWNLGVNLAHEIRLSPTSAPVWVGLALGAGVGFGVGTGSITMWHPGYHPATVDPTCGPLDIAPERQSRCAPDGDVRLPGLVPVVDLTIGPVVHIAEHAMVRLDFGIHDLLYYGIAGGGTF